MQTHQLPGLRDALMIPAQLSAMPEFITERAGRAGSI